MPYRRGTFNLIRSTRIIKEKKLSSIAALVSFLNKIKRLDGFFLSIQEKHHHGLFQSEVHHISQTSSRDFSVSMTHLLWKVFPQKVGHRVLG